MLKIVSKQQQLLRTLIRIPLCLASCLWENMPIIPWAGPQSNPTILLSLVHKQETPSHPQTMASPSFFCALRAASMGKITSQTNLLHKVISFWKYAIISWPTTPTNSTILPSIVHKFENSLFSLYSPDHKTFTVNGVPQHHRPSLLTHAAQHPWAKITSQHLWQ